MIMTSSISMVAPFAADFAPAPASTPVSIPAATRAISPAPSADAQDAPVDAFARLVALVSSNDRLRAELAVLDRRLAEAKAYLARPDANAGLAHARLGRVREGRSRVLSALRSNRIAAGEFLAPASS